MVICLFLGVVCAGKTKARAMGAHSHKTAGLTEQVAGQQEAFSPDLLTIELARRTSSNNRSLCDVERFTRRRSLAATPPSGRQLTLKSEDFFWGGELY